jgi:hypothetical protein
VMTICCLCDCEKASGSARGNRIGGVCLVWRGVGWCRGGG